MYGYMKEGQYWYVYG